MSGFDPAWLDLREGADHRARNGDVLATCAAHFATRDHVRVVDLGCGSGSNLRALAPHLPVRQSWRLVDHDSILLDAARARLARWAETAEETGDGTLRLLRGDAPPLSFVPQPSLSAMSTPCQGSLVGRAAP